jgi:ABC-type cobalamin/Fe3+-siderophores transport system ATPase subunit
MLIVEGPDGAGKSTLIRSLYLVTGWPTAPRVVSKDTEAMTNLKVWTERNVAAGFQEVIFDRHRLISDPVYDSIMRVKSPRPEVYDLGWYINTMTQFWALKPMVIMCLPPLKRIQKNLIDDPDNAKVYPYIDRVYRGYVAMTSQLIASGHDIWVYDYTKLGGKDNVFTKVKNRIDQKILENL